MKSEEEIRKRLSWLEKTPATPYTIEWYRIIGEKKALKWVLEEGG